jgi:hypothetical protein
MSDETTQPASPKLGRPSSYTPETASLICERIANGQSIREIAAADDMPAMSTIFRWLAAHEDFREQYVRAKEAQVEFLAEEMLDICDDGSNDWMERTGKDGESLGWVLNGEAVQRSRVRIDTRKWLLSKLAPKKYGDALKLEGALTLRHEDALASLE